MVVAAGPMGGVECGFESGRRSSPAGENIGNIVTGWASKPAAENAPSRASESIVFEDADLLERCRRGEMAAFGPLVTKYQDRVYNAILRMCNNPDDAEELCQETFVKALQSIGNFRQDSRLYTWLFRKSITRRCLR